MKKTPIILLCALLAALPAAHAEPEVTMLPTLAPDVTVTVQTDEYAVDLSGYYHDYDSPYQLPSLTDAEKARVPDLLARYADGERPMKSAINQTESVVLGVYPLPPEDYQGEAVFVLLPGRELTDEELLELVDGYAQMGRTFDAEGLSWRCCMRGGGVESNRTYAGDERERVDTLNDLYKRQGLRPEQSYTAIPGDDGIGEISLSEDEYSGLDVFRLWPCRRMTDEELLRILQHDIGENIPDTSAFGQYESQTRAQATAILGAPLSLKLTYESVGKASEDDMFNDDRETYTAGLISASAEAGALEYWIKLDAQTGLLYTASVLPIQYDALAYSDLRCDPFDEKWLDIARNAVNALRSDGMEIASVESFGEDSMQYGGFCARVTVTMADGSCYALRIPFQTEQVFDFEYRQVPVAPEQEMPVNN